MVGEWVAGCFALPPTPPTTNTSLLSDVRQRTNLASRANTMVQINAYNTTHQHQHQYASVRTLQNTTLEDFLRRETNITTEDNTHILHILQGGGCNYRYLVPIARSVIYTWYQLLLFFSHFVLPYPGMVTVSCSCSFACEVPGAAVRHLSGGLDAIII